MSVMEKNSVATKKDGNNFAEMNGVKFEPDTSKTQEQTELQKEIPEPEQIITTRSVSQQPWIKAVVIGVAVLLAVGFVGVLANTSITSLNSNSSTEIKPSPTVSKSLIEEDIKDSEDSGKTKTALALTSQKGELQDLNKQQSSEKPIEEVKPSPVPPQPQTVSRSVKQPQPQTQPPVSARLQPAPRPQPASTSFYKPPVTPQPRQISQPRPSATPLAKPSAVNPMEKWLAVSNVGNFSSSGTTDDESDNSISLEGIEGGNYVPKSLTSNSNISPKSSKVITQSNESATTDYNQARVLVGTRVEGKLETPIAWSSNTENQENQSYLIRLSQPLKAFDGLEVLPTGSYIVARLIDSNESGFIQMQAVAALINKNGMTEEKNIPENSVLVLGKNGKLLKAKSRKTSSLGSSFTTSVLAGIAKAAEIQNRATSQTNINSSGFSSTTTTNDDKNLAAGFAEGSLNELLQRMQSSNRQRLQEIQSLPKVFIVEAETSVQIFVNQSISL